MNKAFSLFVALSLICSVAPAAAKSSISRGGFGFLYQDTNHFANPALFSQLRGFSFAGDFYKNIDAEEVTANSSAILGNGRVGLGVFAERKGYVLNDPEDSTDSAGVGFGFNFAKNMANVGLEYSRSVDAAAPTDGTVSATFTYQPSGKGFSIGAGGSTTINGDTDVRSAIGALGYAFSPMVQLEGTFSFPDITNVNDWITGGFLNVTGRILYVTSGFTYWTSYMTQTMMARVGFVIGNTVDISGYGTKVLGAPSYSYGANFRFRI